MNALAVNGPGDGLTERQRAFVDLVLQGCDTDEAAKRAGYSDNTPTVSILRSELVKNAIRAGCDAQLEALRVQAVHRIKKLISNDKTPAATMLKAAKLVIERGDGKDAGADKPLSEMGIEDLERLIAAKEAELRDVTPKNGA